MMAQACIKDFLPKSATHRVHTISPEASPEVSLQASSAKRAEGGKREHAGRLDSLEQRHGNPAGPSHMAAHGEQAATEEEVHQLYDIISKQQRFCKKMADALQETRKRSVHELDDLSVDTCPKRLACQSEAAAETDGGYNGAEQPVEEYCEEGEIPDDVYEKVRKEFEKEESWPHL